MLSFIQFIQYATCNNRYKWFNIDTNLMSAFTEEEKAQLYIDELGNGHTRCFYPRDEYLASNEYKALQELKHKVESGPPPEPVSEIDKLRAKIRRAAMNGDIGLFIVLKEELKAMKERP